MFHILCDRLNVSSLNLRCQQDSADHFKDSLTLVVCRVMDHLQTLCEALITNLPLAEEMARDSSHFFSRHLKRFETCVAHILDSCLLLLDVDVSGEPLNDSSSKPHLLAKQRIDQVDQALSAELRDLEMSISEIVTQYPVRFLLVSSNNTLSERLSPRVHLAFSQVLQVQVRKS
jgi:hypothetical protein